MKPSSSIIFCGTPFFALPTLEALAKDERFHIDLVITQPDKPVGRKQVLTAPPVKLLAERLGLPVFQPASLNAQSPFAHVSPPDFLVVVAYGQILSQEILDAATIASVNVHASLLPKFRGASPIHHAVLAGERQTGVTIQRMVQKLDAGPILGQRTIDMGERETTIALHDRLAALGATLLIDTLTAPLTETAQNETEATVCAKLSRHDGLVDPAVMTAEDIDRRVRALSPWPGVTWADRKILAAELSPHPDAMALECRQGSTLFITQIQPAGGRPMTGAEFARGRGERNERASHAKK